MVPSHWKSLLNVPVCGVCRQHGVMLPHTEVVHDCFSPFSCQDQRSQGGCTPASQARQRCTSAPGDAVSALPACAGVGVVPCSGRVLHVAGGGVCPCCGPAGGLSRICRRQGIGWCSFCHGRFEQCAFCGWWCVGTVAIGALGPNGPASPGLGGCGGVLGGLGAHRCGVRGVPLAA